MTVRTQTNHASAQGQRPYGFKKNSGRGLKTVSKRAKECSTIQLYPFVPRLLIQLTRANAHPLSKKVSGRGM